MKIILNNVSKSYDGKEILKDINICIENTSSLGIIGESGSGKSTLLRQIAGIENPNCGDIIVDDKSPITDKKSFQDEIGYVFQKHNLFPHLTIRQNIMLILEKVKKTDKAEAEKITERVLRQLHLEAVANQKPNQLSGGQAQRASIARALATEPKLIFLDEPTASLDPVLTREVLKAVVDLKQNGRNFIFVTHELNFLKEFADYIIFLKDGEICEHGEVSCLESPKTKELEKFVKTY